LYISTSETTFSFICENNKQENITEFLNLCDKLIDNYNDILLKHYLQYHNDNNYIDVMCNKDPSVSNDYTIYVDNVAQTRCLFIKFNASVNFIAIVYPKFKKSNNEEYIYYYFKYNDNDNNYELLEFRQSSKIEFRKIVYKDNYKDDAIYSLDELKSIVKSWIYLFNTDTTITLKFRTGYNREHQLNTYSNINFELVDDIEDGIFYKNEDFYNNFSEITTISSDKSNRKQKYYYTKDELDKIKKDYDDYYSLCFGTNEKKYVKQKYKNHCLVYSINNGSKIVMLSRNNNDYNDANGYTPMYYVYESSSNKYKNTVNNDNLFSIQEIIDLAYQYEYEYNIQRSGGNNETIKIECLIHGIINIIFKDIMINEKNYILFFKKFDEFLLK
jgi:hypothetical protein